MKMSEKLSFVYDGDEALILENNKDIGIAKGKKLLQIIEWVNIACSKYDISFECLEHCLDDYNDFLEDEYNKELRGYVRE